MIEDSEYIAGLIARARKAQKVAEKFSQEEARRVAASIGWLAVNRAEEWAKATYEETKLGDIPSKITRISARARGLMRDINGAKTVGVVEVDEAKQLVKIAKPVGVIGAIIPVTVPETVVFMTAMNSILGRNATVCAPHPRAKKATSLVANDIRTLLKRMGLPEDLVLCVEDTNLKRTNELMKQCDLIIATGGAGLVKAAYSSGTPAYGVGAGNVVVVIDETADLRDAAHKIKVGKLNDLSIGCSTENSVVIQRSVYDVVVNAMIAEGGHLCTTEEKSKLQATLWQDGHLNPDVICKPASYIAAKAGFTIPGDRTWILVEETGYGPEYPFSGEKLSVVVTLYKYDTFDDAIALVNNIQAYSGAGHSCGIHSFDEERILKFALATKTTRVAVRNTQQLSNAGSWSSGMPFTVSLGCGTWGGNITSENIAWKHYINITWVAREIPNFKVPTDEELFGDVVNEKALFEIG
jgi:sulfoacetaldehyde dehydrogenase